MRDCLVPREDPWAADCRCVTARPTPPLTSTKTCRVRRAANTTATPRGEFQMEIVLLMCQQVARSTSGEEIRGDLDSTGHQKMQLNVYLLAGLITTIIAKTRCFSTMAAKDHIAD